MASSPVRWLSDADYSASPVQERALAWASSQVGQKEVGHNAGAFVTKLLASVGLGPGHPWCASFVSWILVKAGWIGGPKVGRAAVRNWRRWGDAAGKIRLHPQRGDLFCWLNADGTGHIGFVAEVSQDEKTFRTIEGNTNVAGSREGDGVYERWRAVEPRVRFIRWWD